jgi:formate dehydrogenase (coenzyme F420) beta subunit
MRNPEATPLNSMASIRGASIAIRELLAWLLSSGRVDAVLTPRRSQETGSCDLALLTTTEGLAEAEPLLPVMTANAGQALSATSISGRRLAAVLKPCELRGFLERVKREQGSFDGLLTVSAVCGGVFPLRKVVAGELDGLLPGYAEMTARGETPPGVRETCAACERFLPMNADISVSVTESGCLMHLHTARAEGWTEGFGGDRIEAEPDRALLDRMLGTRTKAKADLFRSLAGTGGLDGVVDLFGKCVGCHGCSRVCPICYCLQCDFESASLDCDLPHFQAILEDRGGLRLPPDTTLFHLGRLMHMSFSCVGCGMCSDVCPAGIPVAAVFKRTGEGTAALFGYVPGRDLEEPIPVTVFREEEFDDIG